MTEIFFAAFSNSLADVGNKICASKCHSTAKRISKLVGRFSFIGVFEQKHLNGRGRKDQIDRCKQWSQLPIKVYIDGEKDTFPQIVAKFLQIFQFGIVEIGNPCLDTQTNAEATGKNFLQPDRTGSSILKLVKYQCSSGIPLPNNPKVRFAPSLTFEGRAFS